ncbi:hypothetical protein FACS1894109_13210 [Spirochaetia bacterium]|nr:hypothetical protein FACS1894109_13210 [Spirochaetia bacterium]
MEMDAMNGLYEGCSSILERECGLLRELESLQKLVWDAVTSREWTDFEAHISRLNNFSAEFNVLEAERMKILAEFQGNVPNAPHASGEETRFYAMVSQFPDAERNELTKRYRELKSETLRVRISNDSLLTYLAEAKSTVAGFLEAAFPDRRGRVYSRSGAAVPADMRSMVLNHQF